MPAYLTTGSVPAPDDEWTVFTASGTPQDGFRTGAPSVGTTMILYVSSSGTDSASATEGSFANPYLTITKAFSRVRDGSPDQVLLANGDTFTEQIGYVTKNGKSESERFVLGSYDKAIPGVVNPGSGGARPIWRGAPQQGQEVMIGSNSGGTPGCDYWAVVGIYFYSYTRDPGNPNYNPAHDSGNSGNPWGAIVTFGGAASHYFLIEDCEFSHFHGNLGVVSTGLTTQNYYLRRNVIRNAWGTGGSAEATAGLYFDGGTLHCFQNVWDHNGWEATMPDDIDLRIRSRNLYIQAGGSSSTVIEGDMHFDSSAEALQMRSGGEMINTLVTRCPIGMDVGHRLSDDGVIVTSSLIHYNVFTDLRDIYPATDPRGTGIVLSAVQGTGNVVEHNIVKDLFPLEGKFGVGFAYDVDTSNTITRNNVLFNWISTASGADNATVEDNGTSNTITPNQFDINGDNAEFSFSHPERTVGSYAGTVGLTATTDGLRLARIGLRKQNWNANYLAEPVCAYIRAGFDMSEPP